MDEIRQTKQQWLEFYRVQTIMLAGAFWVVFFQLGWNPLIIGSSSLNERSFLATAIGALAIPVLLYGIWHMTGRLWKVDAEGWRMRQKYALQTDTVYRVAMERNKRNMFLCVLIGTTLALALYFFRYPPPALNARALISALLLGAIGGQLVSSIIYLARNRKVQ